MRQAFAHQATLEMASGADLRAPGAAVTVAVPKQGVGRPPRVLGLLVIVAV